MWEPVSLPFKNNFLPLPSLPTADETRACTNVLWDGVSKVVAINDEIVAKFGGSVDDWEGQALVYLERHASKVSAPRLYAMYHDSDQLFLVMQRAPGVQLDSIWPTLTESEKDDVIAKLGQTFDVMREANQKGDQKYLGPFYGEAAFVAGLVENFRVLTERNGRPDYKVRFYETYLPRVLQGHRPTLTHGDVQQKNIMIAENASQNKKGERSFDITLVDWAYAGWYPDFWEFFCASSPFIFFYWEEDWCWRAQQFLHVYPAEMAMMRMIDKDLGL